MSEESIALAHALPGRLRYRVSTVADRKLNIAHLEASLAALPGVEGVRINPGAWSVVVEYDGLPATREAVEAALNRSLDREGPSFLEGFPARGGVEFPDVMLSGLLLLVQPWLPRGLQAITTFLSIAPRLLAGADTLIRKGIKVETLDALAVGLAAAGEEYFTANVTEFLLKLGEYLERSTAQHTEALLAELLRPRISHAWVERNGELRQVGADEVRTGEVVVVGPGEAIPVDGEVVEGTASVNQASLTGESVPVRREPPTAVVCGTIVEAGRIRVRADYVGEETTLARITHFIREALRTHSHTQQLANELADRRVYITLSVAVLVYLLTRSPRRLAAVFLVDYSCAFKLGTAVAFKASLYQAAKHGILVKGGQALEELSAVDTIVFDKTGTLSHGALEVTDVHTLTPELPSAERLLALVASVEEHTTHPVAEAVVEAARQKQLRHIGHGEVEFIVAHGLRTRVDGSELLIGSRHYLEEHESVSFKSSEPLIQLLEAEGKELLFVAGRRKLVGIIALRDHVRDEAATILARLRASGIRTLVLLTGDRQAKATALARELDMDEVYAERAPEEKAAVVQTLQDRGCKVAFVGDGVNDAPALGLADVGVAMPRGADIARQTADIVLLEDHLRGVVAAREQAVRTMQLIRTNFNVAVGVNSGVIVGAALGWLSPVATALLHNGTTIGVLLNALLARREGSAH